jgi:hypothetical protein
VGHGLRFIPAPAFALGLAHLLLEEPRVHPDPVRPLQPHGEPVLDQQIRGQVAAQTPQGLAQAVARLAFAAIAPQQPGQTAAIVLAGVQEQLDVEGLGLAQGKALGALSIPANLESPQCVDG